MIEQLYDEIIRKLRRYVNYNRKDAKNINAVTKFLENLINRIEYVTNLDNSHNILEERLIRELKKFSKELFVKTNNTQIYEKNIQRNIDRLTWINLKHKINKSARTYTVAQREVFYANLGDNVGSEQNGRRPVIILQNNTGNRKGNTTIIAPVTTHGKSALKYDVDKKMYYIEKNDGNQIKRKYLGQYEVPLKLEGTEPGLYGFINVMHIREIDRKRIASEKVGVATKECFQDVIKAVNQNLQS